MPQPTPYDRITNLQNDQALEPSAAYPAPVLDQEYNAIKITTDEILQNLELIQRDDGQLQNDSVGFDQLREEVVIGFDAPVPWETLHDYVAGNTVFADDGFYYCVTAHTSGVFATDLAAGHWSIIVDFGAQTDDAEAAAAAAAASAAAAAASELDAEEAAIDANAAQGAFRWNFDSSTTMADPGVGDVRGNGTPASAMTSIAISAQTADIGNPNILPWILTWDDSTNTASRGTIYVRKVADPENFAVFNLTGTVANNGTWAQIGVTYITHSGTLVDGEPVSVAFMRTGNAGSGGAGSGDMLAANNLSDVASVATSRTNLGVGSGDVPVFSQVTLSNAPSSASHAATKAYVDSDPVGTRRNRIVNGAMQISQEQGNTSGATNAFFFADQWKMGTGSAATCTAQRVQLGTPQGSQDRARIVVTIADAVLDPTDFLLFRETLEGIDVSDFKYGFASARQAVLRFGWRSVAGTYSIALFNGAGDRSYVANFTISAGEALTDTEQTFVIPGDTTGTWLTDTNVGIHIQITMATGSARQGALGWQAGFFFGTASNTSGIATIGNLFELFDVGFYLDVDNTGIAPKWEMPDPAAELAKCQRYYEKTDPAAALGSLYAMTWPEGGALPMLNWFYKQEKRATPTVGIFGTWNIVNFTGAMSFIPSTTVTTVYQNASTGGSVAYFHNNANSGLYANARM